MEWKVKRRQDGSRYIVRRPVRNRTLRAARATKINEERSNDQTTEDDTISEVKTGRYWTKEDRKKHMEKSRERRHRQESIIATKNQQMNEQYQNNGIPMTGNHVQGSQHAQINAQYQQQPSVPCDPNGKRTLKKKKDGQIPGTATYDNVPGGGPPTANNRNSGGAGGAGQSQIPTDAKLAGLLSVTTV